MLAAVAAPLASAQTTFVVNMTTDTPDAALDGICDTDAGTPGQQCTLRAAIQESENTTAADQIHFNIPGAGPHTISVTGTNLPTMSDPVTIDGYTQPGASVNTNGPGQGSNAVIMIELVNGGGRTHGLRLCIGQKIIRGLAVGGFSSAGISMECDAAGGHVVEGCFVGTDATGMVARGNGSYGVGVFGSSGNRIGGVTPVARNVISGNGLSATSLGGVHIGGQDPTGNLVQGNLIGTNAAGAAGIPNTPDGVRLQHVASGAGVVIGGATPAERNVISGNAGRGLTAAQGVGVTTDFSGIRIEGNFIGTDVSGSLPLGNAGDGVRINGLASDLRVGGTTPATGNRIAHNGAAGVAVAGVGDGNRVIGNEIFANGGLGIDLGPGGIAVNDPGDPDLGSNLLQNHPLLVSVTMDPGGQLVVDYLIDSAAPNSTYPIDVEFFRADAGGEGEAWLGSAVYSSVDHSGCGAPPCVATATFTPMTPVTAGDSFVATATDAAGNTSEFTSDVVTGADPLPDLVTALLPPSPNPARGLVRVRYELAEGLAVRLALIDILGREVALLDNGTRGPGMHAVVLDGRLVSPGVYRVLLEAGSDRESRSLSITR